MRTKEEQNIVLKYDSPLNTVYYILVRKMQTKTALVMEMLPDKRSNSKESKSEIITVKILFVFFTKVQEMYSFQVLSS